MRVELGRTASGRAACGEWILCDLTGVEIGLGRGVTPSALGLTTFASGASSSYLSWEVRSGDLKGFKSAEVVLSFRLLPKGVDIVAKCYSLFPLRYLVR